MDRSKNGVGRGGGDLLATNNFFNASDDVTEVRYASEREHGSGSLSLYNGDLWTSGFEPGDALGSEVFAVGDAEDSQRGDLGEEIEVLILDAGAADVDFAQRGMRVGVAEEGTDARVGDAGGLQEAEAGQPFRGPEGDLKFGGGATVGGGEVLKLRPLGDEQAGKAGE